MSISQNLPSDIERRTFDIDNFIIETREDSQQRTIIGHAAVFNKTDGPSWFREQIAPGAFAESIQTDDIRALFNHDPNIVLGRNKAGTLTLTEDEAGLRMEISPPETGPGRDLLVSIERGDISQASFAFQTIDDEIRTIDGVETRILKKVRLFDVSPVTYPFYEATDVGLRNRLEEKKRVEAKRNNQRRRHHITMLRHSK
jgi:HK97 family phage prohead protease